ncbi:MAG: glutamate--cysteine ligase [Flavobacteriales bacterium]|nr:glutamate--cysteine ligase [Flavobacteriales bacterium]
MSQKRKYGLFEVTGIELEYMVVDRSSLRILPIVDVLFKDVVGHMTGDVERGDVEWSNELVAHVVELKTAKPTPDIARFNELFHQEVRAINQLLRARGAMLLPTAAHPFMDPFTETTIWPHEHNEVYALYDRIFDCRGHGWSNLQSTHLNLPFANDEEFGQLHAAIRILLPLIPALSASSPILDGKVTGMFDSRMHAYLHHQERLPVLMGALIPERVYDQASYEQKIFKPIMNALAPFDTEKVMERHFSNSRGAIARFDRGAIEIRVIDIQECPAMDLGIAEIIVATLRRLVQGEWCSPEAYRTISEHELLRVFKQVIQNGRHSPVDHPELLKTFGLYTATSTGSIWEHIFATLAEDLSPLATSCAKILAARGCLAERIMGSLGERPDQHVMTHVYQELAGCLEDNRPF